MVQVGSDGISAPLNRGRLVRRRGPQVLIRT